MALPDDQISVRLDKSQPSTSEAPISKTTIRPKTTYATTISYNSQSPNNGGYKVKDKDAPFAPKWIFFFLDYPSIVIIGIM
ncbi:hypothetical protein HAX54_011068 [Datura stramonium]|uniref:Uncharacterized protein n=1 Tax=Datura stramonium TaxID=4076 RepID=A0ABS8TH99_DATST|nr:hypothetical protein [Datura stramonium]